MRKDLANASYLGPNVSRFTDVHDAAANRA
jgi:hypothetical protein